MAREAVLRVRMSADELAAAEARSSELGFENVSQFVRAMIRVSPVSKITGIEPTGVSINSAGELAVEGRVTTAPCPKRHVAGVYCKYCGVTP